MWGTRARMRKTSPPDPLSRLGEGETRRACSPSPRRRGGWGVRSESRAGRSRCQSQDGRRRRAGLPVPPGEQGRARCSAPASSRPAPSAPGRCPSARAKADPAPHAAPKARGREQARRDQRCPARLPPSPAPRSRAVELVWAADADPVSLDPLSPAPAPASTSVWADLTYQSLVMFDEHLKLVPVPRRGVGQHQPDHLDLQAAPGRPLPRRQRIRGRGCQVLVRASGAAPAAARPRSRLARPDRQGRADGQVRGRVHARRSRTHRSWRRSRRCAARRWSRAAGCSGPARPPRRRRSGAGRSRSPSTSLAATCGTSSTPTTGRSGLPVPG